MSISSKLPWHKIWFRDVATYPVLITVGAGIGLVSWYGYRLAFKHNDVTLDKKRPYQFRTQGGTPKFVETKSYTRKNLVYNEQLQKWE
jgi:hypothetical protein